MSISQIPQEILEELNKYKKHVDNRTCLNCGYIGPMGIKNFKLTAIHSLIIGAFIFVPLYFWLNLSPIIVIISMWIILALIESYIQKTLTVCPKCGKGKE